MNELFKKAYPHILGVSKVFIAVWLYYQLVVLVRTVLGVDAMWSVLVTTIISCCIWFGYWHSK